MKKQFTFALALFFSVLATGKIYAQADEQRNKIQLLVNYGGKAIKTDLNSLSTSISRYTDEETIASKLTADTSKNKPKIAVGLNSTFYLTLDAKKIDTELMKVFAKRQTRFDGSITITDTYGKNPPTVIKFKQAALYSYSDTFSAASYGEAYGNAAISITCKELAINDILIEQ
ncbi:MAG: hypothetical protein EOP42_28760 [Sphingobacteriaceae bacterium]|nr:MAG: hypothetical protein EOP42_28760 [Sphingobacteriaceae bacterium]